MCQINSDKGVRSLCTAIIAQAAIDYKKICRKNVSEIGEADEKISMSEIEDFFKSQFGKICLNTVGGHYSGEQIINLLKKNKQIYISRKKIAAYSYNGDLVATFNTLDECAKFAGLKYTSHISDCCNNHRKTAGGYVWKYI